MVCTQYHPQHIYPCYTILTIHGLPYQAWIRKTVRYTPTLYERFPRSVLYGVSDTLPLGRV
jgi:hypothetical protein